MKVDVFAVAHSYGAADSVRIEKKTIYSKIPLARHTSLALAGDAALLAKVEGIEDVTAFDEARSRQAAATRVNTALGAGWRVETKAIEPYDTHYWHPRYGWVTNTSAETKSMYAFTLYDERNGPTNVPAGTSNYVKRADGVTQLLKIDFVVVVAPR